MPEDRVIICMMVRKNTLVNGSLRREQQKFCLTAPYQLRFRKDRKDTGGIQKRGQGDDEGGKLDKDEDRKQIIDKYFGLEMCAEGKSGR